MDQYGKINCGQKHVNRKQSRPDPDESQVDKSFLSREKAGYEADKCHKKYRQLFGVADFNTQHCQHGREQEKYIGIAVEEEAFGDVSGGYYMLVCRKKFQQVVIQTERFAELEHKAENKGLNFRRQLEKHIAFIMSVKKA